MRLRKFQIFLAGILTAVLLSSGSGVSAQTASLNFYGMPGLIDMPTGETAPDGQLATTVATFSGMTRNTMSFQITPRLSGSFRYTALQDCNCFGFATYYDRSFDLHYQLFDEGRWRPAIAVGLRDLIGTGIYSGEYLAATKSLTSNLKVTAGIGWGRLGSYNSFANPLGLDTRPTGFGLGGLPGVSQWFRGPAALFAGAQWQTPLRGLTVKVEYSSDAYIFESGAPGLIAPQSPFNFGLEYQINRAFQVSGYYMYGAEIGVRATLALNPKERVIPGSLEGSPTPVFRRARNDEAGAALVLDTDWTEQPDSARILMQNLQTVLEDDGFTIEATSFTATRAEVRFRNKFYDSTSQAVGRVARMMTRVLPVSIETFVLTPLEDGLPVVTVTLQRRDLEDFENLPDGTERSLAAAQFTDPVPLQGPSLLKEGLYPGVNWSVQPYWRYSLFDPDNPFRADVGIRAEGVVEISPGLSVSGSVIKKAFGNLDTVTRVSNSVLPHVRSDFGIYDKQADPAMEFLRMDYLFKPGRNLYGRVSAGYLEEMYGGLSAELLWKPVNSRLALGTEINLVRQRAFDMGFGFQSYQTVTGFVSAYLDMKNGFSTQLDVGRYLAGDVGATLTVERRFNNGWRIGAFATLTNVPFSDFGEGSFDKGLRFTIPLSWAIGRPNRRVTTAVIRPVTRDGGARLNMRNRLYPIVNAHHRERLEPNWGRFWR
jgi:exopolysaccharide biosynthesis protein YbjH